MKRNESRLLNLQFEVSNQGFSKKTSLGHKRSSLVSGNRSGETFFFTHPSAYSNLYQNTYFKFKKIDKPSKKTRIKKSKRNYRRKENISGKSIKKKNCGRLGEDFSCHSRISGNKSIFFWPKYNSNFKSSDRIIRAHRHQLKPLISRSQKNYVLDHMRHLIL